VQRVFINGAILSVDGSHWHEGVVTAPPGFKQTYEQFIDGGWPGLAQRTAFGGKTCTVLIFSN